LRWAGSSHRVEVIEVAKELIESVHGRQELVAVAQVVLAELAGGIAHRLEGPMRSWAPAPACRPWLPAWPTVVSPRADRQFAGDEIGATGSAARLGIIVGEPHPLSGEAVEVRGSGPP